MWDMPYFGGSTELTVEMLDTVVEYIRRQGRIVSSPEIAVDQTPDGWVLRLANPLGVWGRLDGADGSGRYGWTQMELAANGRFLAHPNGNTGTPQSLWAEEANGLSCPAGTVVWLEPTGDVPARYAFGSPRVAGADLDTFWAELTEAADGYYGYTEVALERDAFWPPPNPRTATAAGFGRAVEASGATAVTVGSVVLMYDFATVNGARPPSEQVVFRFGASATRWGRLAGRTTNTVYRLSTGGATGACGLTVADADGGVTWTARVPADAPAQSVQDGLTTAIAEPLVRVTDAPDALPDGGGPFLIEFLGRLGGRRAVTLTVDGTALAGGAADAAFADGLDDVQTSGPATWVRVAAGADDPYTDGTGAYGWYEVTCDAAGVFRPVANGLMSDWPLGAAYAAGGETNVPPGAVVRIYPGPTVLRSDGTSDARYLFQWTGERGQWAMIGTAARWEFDLLAPTAGMWVLRWDDHNANPLAVRRNLATVFSASPSTPTFQITWNQAVPTRRLVSGVWVTQSVQTSGPTFPLPATAGQIQAGLEAAYPMLAGNLRVTGGPLGTATTVVTPPTDPCGSPVTTMTFNAVTVECVGELGECHGITGFVNGPATSLPNLPGTTSGSGSRILLAYNTSLGLLSYTTPGSLAGIAGMATADYGVAFARQRTTTPSVSQGSHIPFTIEAAGYDGDASLPTVSVASFLKYGTDGTGAVPVPVVSAAPMVPVGAATARLGRGLYYACPLSAYQPDGSAVAALVPVATDDRIAVVSAFEATGRDDVLPRSVVRLWTTGRGDYAPGATAPLPERWAFNGPATGFWATVAAPASGGAYRVTPLLSGWAKLRFVVAREANGNAAVPVGARVWVQPSAGDTRFVLTATPANAVVVLAYTGAIVPAEPAVNGYVLAGGPAALCSIAGDPADWVAGVTLAGVQTGTVPAPGGGTHPVYTVESGRPVAAGGAPGLVSAGAQVLGGGDKVTIGGRIGWGPTPVTGPVGGEPLPAGARWGCESTATSTFTGSKAAGGGRWGWRASGPPLPFMVQVLGLPLSINTAFGPTDTQIDVLGTGNSGSGDAAAPFAVTVPFYVGAGAATGTYEVLRVTQICDHPTTALRATWTVERAQLGSTAAAHPTSQGLYPLRVYPVGTAFGPAKVTFWTDQAAFAHEGTPGGTQSGCVIPGHHASYDYTLDFAGGLQTAIRAGDGSVPGVSAINLYSTRAAGQRSVVVTAGRVASATLVPFP